MMANALVVGGGRVSRPLEHSERSSDVPAMFQRCGWFVAAASGRLRTVANNDKGKE
jgi:hypothetical protein